MDGLAAGAAGVVQELLPDPVLENIGRALPLNGMRTCRLVCKRWAAVIGESVAAVGVPADMLRAVVLSDHPPANGPGGGHGGDSGCDSDAGSSSSEGGDADGGGTAAAARRSPVPSSGASDASSSDAGRPRADNAAAMRRLRRLSRKLARAFPRAHTCVIHIDVGCVAGGAQAAGAGGDRAASCDGGCWL